MKSIETYSLPKLCDCKGDLTKSWYVSFYYTDSLTSEKKLFRYKLGINRYKTKAKRTKEALAIIEALMDKLSAGWNPFTGETNGVKDTTTFDAMFEILQLKKSYITARSYKTYYDQINLFGKWLIETNHDSLYAYNITPIIARQYFDWLLKVKRYSGKTYNSHLTTLRTFFNALVERGYIHSTPLEGLKTVRQTTGDNTTYSKEEEDMLIEAMSAEDPWFYLATRFVKYCFLRRPELARVQAKHINWESKTIVIPAENSKSRRQDSITISKTLEALIEDYRLLELRPNTFIFGKGFSPSPVRMKRVDDFTDLQRAYNKRFNVKAECSFYSWKHTGAVELYQLTKDPYVVMRQCRHTDIKMTMIYLRSMGCGVNEAVRGW